MLSNRLRLRSVNRKRKRTVSHRFKRLKPLGKSKKNMKNESAESRNRLPTVRESADVYDFLYVDRARISALYAQLFPQGILTSVKTTAQQNFSDEDDIGTDVRVFKAGTKSSEGGSRVLSIYLMHPGPFHWRCWRGWRVFCCYASPYVVRVLALSSFQTAVSA